MYQVRNATKDKVLALEVREARSFVARFKGLMGVPDLPLGHGLHIVPCNSIHTFFMRIAIDAIFLDRSHKVVKALPAMPPWRVSSVYFEAHSVLELPAGVIQASGTAPGDALEFVQTATAPAEGL